MHFTVIPFNVTQKFMDTSFLGWERQFFPPTMGLRTQALKLKFTSSKIGARFLEPMFTFQDAISITNEKSKSSDFCNNRGNIYHSAFIGETVSLIYAPYYVKDDSVYDGILDRPVCKMTDQLEQMLNERETRNIREIEFTSALCPDCGADLTGARSSVVLTCYNCDTAWHPVKGIMKKIEFHVVPGDEQNVMHIPFWKLKVNIDGLELKSMADLIRTANLPRAVQPEQEGEELHFYSPACTIAPKTFLRLCRQMTIIQPDEEYKERLPSTPLCPVSLDDREAFNTTIICLSNMIAAKRKVYPQLPDVKATPESAVLVYIPFRVSGSEFIHDKYKFGIQRNAIRNLDP